MTRTIRLSDGKAIPAIGCGNGSGGLMRGGSKATEIGKTVLDAGIHHLDTAQMYETEEETGAAIKAAGLTPADVWVTTKGE
jgi:diketogulonate reductase-like aldo/keto reductase